MFTPKKTYETAASEVQPLNLKRMARPKSIMTAIATSGLAVSLVLVYQARASLRNRDEQLRGLRDRMVQLEEEVARLSLTGPWDLTAEDREAYLSLDYKEFDATPGSGFRRYRDQPQNPAHAGALIEVYLERHSELPLEKQIILRFHAAQLFAMGGMNERAIKHMDWILSQNPADHGTAATKAFLLFDREGLLAARRRMADGEAAQVVDFLIERFGESYADIVRWCPICSTVSVPANASAEHRAAADELAQAFGLPVTLARDAPREGGIPGGCIWLEVRPMGGTPDVEGYIILHANKSTLITATSEQRLDAAVKRFIETSHERNGQYQARFGLATSFEPAR